MGSSSGSSWAQLTVPWQRAFDEAWTAWRAGSLGIGAVLVDPESGDVVSAGRNRTAEPRTETGVLAGNFMAHAEMNAFALLDRFKADGLHLYTTLEPCLMCAATSIFMHVDTAFFAAADPFFEGIHDVWDHHPYSLRNKHTSIGPLGGEAAVVSTVLLLSRMSPDLKSYGVTAEANPVAARVVGIVTDDGSLQRLAARDAGVAEVFDLIEHLAR